MTVTILYFAGLREALGTGRETVDLPAGVATAAQLRAWLRSRGGAWAEALAEGRAIRIAIDQAMARADTPVRQGAEVAFFPPVTGG
ncbi:MAG: molybdopterin converting factor subunit 1 [Burkholderiaceae bacterium]|jgi:molybdopterin synthase sulfur carrier subunit|nr:molybdopterin converting factor subunit 1 [Burkholderiaceae bacterium]HMN66028.1 molybdopterin converting factor subunit 1 [Burkholderiaceae bacterium]